MPEVHDNRGEGNWSDAVGDWESEFDEGDVVIGDGYGHFRGMVMVHEIQLSSLDSVVHRGIFWHDDLAEQFAEALSEQTPFEKEAEP